MFDVGPDLGTMLIIFGSVIIGATLVSYFISRRNNLVGVLVFSTALNYFTSLFYEWPSLYKDETVLSFFVNKIWPIINIIFFIFLITRYILKLKSQKND